MVSRYAIYDIAEISNRFGLTDGLPKGVKPQYNVSPTTGASVIIGHEGGRISKLMKWGLVAKGAMDTNSVFRYKTYNIASEKIFSRHSWELAVRQSRCLVPANGFYELNGDDENRAYYAQPEDKSLLAFAGVYSSWQDPEGIVHGTYSIITTDADHNLSHFGSRLPVIIKPEDEDRWLDPTVDDANILYGMLLRSYSSDLPTSYEVDSVVRSSKSNQPSLIDQLHVSE